MTVINCHQITDELTKKMDNMINAYISKYKTNKATNKILVTYRIRRSSPIMDASKNEVTLV